MTAWSTVTPAACERTTKLLRAGQKLETLLESNPVVNVSVQVGKLSGGQRRRLALAAALLGSPDLLVLDEPTNHMDVEMIQWMAAEIMGSQDMAVVMVRWATVT